MCKRRRNTAVWIRQIQGWKRGIVIDDFHLFLSSGNGYISFERLFGDHGGTLRLSWSSSPAPGKMDSGSRRESKDIFGAHIENMNGGFGWYFVTDDRAGGRNVIFHSSCTSFAFILVL
jgi:hypothetical protein